ncbi:Por secretion system C-terminal sorting domain-containing protein [Flavobacterium fluvii]|uniref:Por secretion system C-terminal sorting domain-containing protein n=1 Tax=Flavobacterium fluvii TaxID=468056 RepID=A0A1M5FCI0_9FLAO|nr:G8 domain-containing protein [Flavobacterium fluvii]SHF89206.1 Por secretion system C-terminal sorting domain-containing protein [Flavobacterium fluvii]
MNKTYLSSVKNTALSIQPSKAIRLLLMVLFVGLFGIGNANAATRTVSVNGDWNNTATWGGSSVPTISDDVVIPNGKTVTVTADALVKSIIVNNGGTLNVNSPAVLTVGTIGTSATTQVVDFQNGSYVNVYTGASMIVYGLLNNSNNSDNVKFDGTVSVDGNITVGNGSIIGGLGSLSSTGSVTGAGTIFQTGNDCSSGNGCNYGCSANTISVNQTICSGSTATLTGNSGTGYSYQWQSSTTSSSSGFSNISGATSSSYTSSSLATTTYYRRIVSVSGCSTSNSNVIKVTINPVNTVGTASSSPTPCINTIMTSITHATTNATGIGIPTGLPTGVTAAWASNTITIGGTPTQPGTFNYSIPLTGGCGTVNATGTITVNPNLASVSLTISGSSTVCLVSSGTSLSVAETAGATIASRQWGTRSVSGETITPIGGATTSAFTVGTGLTAGTWIVVCTSTSSCGVSVVSNEITVTVNAPPANPGPITGSTTQCAGNTSQVYSVAPVAGAISFDWYIPADWTITSGAGTNSITVTVGSNSGNINVNAINTCGTGYGPYIYVAVAAPTVAGIVTPANTNVCSNSNSTNLSLSGYTGSIVRWESSTDDFATAGIPIAHTGTPYTASGLTTDTYYRAVVQSGTCNVLYSNSVKITVTPAMSALGGISVNGSAPYPISGAGISHCASTTTVFSIASVANATSYTWVIPTGWTNVTGQGTTTLTATTGNNSQSANIEVYAENPVCGKTNSSYLYLYLVPSTAPVLALTQPTCAVSTGTITVTSPAPVLGITYTLVGTNPVVTAVTNDTGVFSGLSVGSYDVTVNNGTYISAIPKVVLPFTACASNTSSATISSLVTNTWTAGAWNNGTPTIDQNLVFSEGFSSTADVTGCSCTVTNGNVAINTGHNLKITNWVNVNGGSLTFANGASLVQINNVPNSGNINYVRTTNTAVLSTDYTYWSSPVSPQTIGGFSPKTQEGMMYSYDSSIDDWKQEYLSTSMAAGAGYIVRGPEPVSPPPPPSTYTAIFVGVPHNGDYSIPAIADRSYLVGNPYPSALDADQFLVANAGVLNGTLYFWTHNTPIGTNVSNPGSGVYAYSSDDYATYNATGGVGAAPPDLDPLTGLPYPGQAPSGGSVPNGKIGAGQGFFASTKTSISGSSIVYTNNMRVGVGGITGDNIQFFKTRNPKDKATSPIKKNRVWLNLTNTQGAFKQTLIGYITDATNGYDNRFDGESYDGNEFVDFYSINDDKNLTIQGRALPFDENDGVPLGLRTTINGTFTISIDEVDGSFTKQAVFLEDKLTNTVTDLKSGNYTFNTTAGTFNDRFVLRYTNKTANQTLSVDKTDTNDGIIVLYSNNYKTLIINNKGQGAIVNSVSLFNMSGQQINSWDVKDSEQTNVQIPIKNISSEIYVVKVKTTKGETRKKIIIR